MTMRYGIKIRNETDQVTVEAEAPLIAALKVKTAHREAAITYVRKQNARGDRCHPRASQIDKKPAVADLETALAGLPAEDAATTVARFFAAPHPAILGAGPEDVAAALAAALAPN